MSCNQLWLEWRGIMVEMFVAQALGRWPHPERFTVQPAWNLGQHCKAANSEAAKLPAFVGTGVAATRDARDLATMCSQPKRGSAALLDNGPTAKRQRKTSTVTLPLIAKLMAGMFHIYCRSHCA